MKEIKINNLIVEAEKIYKIADIIKTNNIEEVSFEFLVGSCFPNVLQNIKEKLRRQYTLGYAAGLEIKNKKNKSKKTPN